jgi:hypothetical protein
MFVYTDTLASAGNVATSSTANTESDTIYFKAGARNLLLQAMYAIGKGAGLTAISGIVHRIVKFATASSSGTAAAIVPKDPGAQAALHTAFTGGTEGTTRTQQVIFGHGAAGPGGWVAPNPDSMIVLQGAATNSMDCCNASGTASLNFEFSCETVE